MPPRAGCRPHQPSPGAGEDGHQVGPQRPRGPCGLQGLYYSVLPHGGFKAVGAADSSQLVTGRAVGGIHKEGVESARKLGAKWYRKSYVQYLLLFDIWARGMRVTLGHQHADGCPPLREYHPHGCKGLSRDFWGWVGWPDDSWPIEREQNVVEDCGRELFSESKDVLSFAWTELAVESCRSSRNLIRAGQAILPFLE